MDHTCPSPINEKKGSKKRQKREKQQLKKGDVLELNDEGDIDLGEEIPSQYSSRPHGTFDEWVCTESEPCSKTELACQSSGSPCSAYQWTAKHFFLRQTHRCG